MKKFNVTLAQMRSMDIFTQVSQPITIFHMTNRRNLNSIRNDGEINTGYDYVCWFFPDIESIPLYIELTGADRGRKYYDFDGMIHTAPPLIHEETVVLRLTPRYKEPWAWFIENAKPELAFADYRGEEEARKKIEQFNNARICHYGNLRFKKHELSVMNLNEIC